MRHPANPILTAEDWPYPVNAVFNPAAAQLDGTTVLLARVEDLTGLSHLTVARSATESTAGRSTRSRCLRPADGIESEQWGFEDARVVWVAELERWVITCTVVRPGGPGRLSRDDRGLQDASSATGSFSARGQERGAAARSASTGSGSSFTARRREFGSPRPHGAISLSRSADLVELERAGARCCSPRDGAWWDSRRIGIGPPLLETEHGWLLDLPRRQGDRLRRVYRVGLALLDLDEPTRVLHRLPNWIFGPHDRVRAEGDVPNVVFPCGFVHDEADRRVRLYYGAADTSICLATARLDDLLDAVRGAPAETAS